MELRNDLETDEVSFEVSLAPERVVLADSWPAMPGVSPL